MPTPRPQQPGRNPLEGLPLVELAAVLVEGSGVPSLVRDTGLFDRTFRGTRPCLRTAQYSSEKTGLAGLLFLTLYCFEVVRVCGRCGNGSALNSGPIPRLATILMNGSKEINAILIRGYFKRGPLRLSQLGDLLLAFQQFHLLTMVLTVNPPRCCLQRTNSPTPTRNAPPTTMYQCPPLGSNRAYSRPEVSLGELVPEAGLRPESRLALHQSQRDRRGVSAEITPRHGIFPRPILAQGTF